MSSFAEEFHRFSDKARPIVGTCIYALVAGVAAVGFELAINWIYGHSFATVARDDRHFLLVITACLQQ